LLTPAVVRALVAADAAGASAVIATGGPGEGLEPLLGRYEPDAYASLERAARAETAPLREVVGALRPQRLEVPAEALFNVNSPADLARAERVLARPTRR
jgi:molybdopterin-guanine dinucleotide biosynthesis protein A